MPNLYIIGGANGSEKTTVALSLLPTLLGVFEYVNADAIATGLSPLNPEAMAMQSGRLMLKRIKALADVKADFAFETTLAAKSFVPFLRKCKTKGYTINLMYFWLRSQDLAIERVARRVASGGHSIPEADIRRRYQRGIRNLFNLYLPLCDGWMVFDNSDPAPKLIAEAIIDEPSTIYGEGTWQQICKELDG
ncbi:MAG: zeta toxin family protein [Thermosynechococcaceae cyanobacterium]